MHLEVPRIKFKRLIAKNKSESSTKIRRRVERARMIQRERLRDFGILTNAEMGIEEIKKFCLISTELEKMLGLALETLGLSARAYHRTLKIARTIADLAHSKLIKKEHIAEALSYRPKEQKVYA
jgi:magnesium chelatase family protein